MEEEKYQKELFEFEEPKRSFSKIADMLPKADLEGRMTMAFTMEKMVFVSIGIVMAMVIVYALGVENGRSGARRSAPPAPKQARAPRAPAQAKPSRQAAVPAVAQNRAASTAQKNILNTSPVSAAPSAASADSKPYSVLAASFRNRDTAQATLTMLRKQGLSAFILYKEPYHKVYVGLYADRSSAQAHQDLAKVKRIFKDAFIKLR